MKYKLEYPTLRYMPLFISLFDFKIRELALDISKWFPFHVMGMTANEIKEFGRDLMTQAIELLDSPRIRDAESGAVLFEFFCQRWAFAAIDGAI